jgi:hypothetical protein
VSLATFQDANAHLDGTKLSFADDANAAPEALEADRIVRGRLANRFPDQANLWHWDDDDLPTPELIREAASLLMASYRYNKVYSEITVTPNKYAIRLENRANMILDGIVSGLLILVDVPYGLEADTEFTSANFWPNNSSTMYAEEIERRMAEAYPEFQSTRRFTMGMKF